MTFFNMEDAWDDGDEVLGAIIDKGKAITFSIEPYHWIAETGGALPESERGQQFMLSMLFTPESALNLRAMAYVYQDGADYGRLGVLQIPKGHYHPGPEQIDSAIDQDPVISQQITWWNRLGSDVIRGHTTRRPRRERTGLSGADFHSLPAESRESAQAGRRGDPRSSNDG